MKTEKDFEKYLSEIEKIAAEEGYDSLDETYVAHLRARYFGEPVIIGETKRLVLREMQPEDIDAFYAFEDAGCEEVLGSFIKESKESSRKHLQAYIENMYPLYDYGIWAVELRDTKELIGLCGLGQTEVKGECCTDLGYYICPKCRNMGFASECVQFVLDYAKNYLEFPWIYAIIKEENRISKGILRKFGFEYLEVCESPEGKLSVYQKELMRSGNE